VLVNHWLLPFALILLWLPRQWLRNGGSVMPTPRLRRRASPQDHDPRDLSLRWQEEFFKFRNWVDVLRAAVGSWAVANACFSTTDDAAKSVYGAILALKVLALLIAVLIQTTRRERREITLVAPVFFMMGLSFGLIGTTAAFFACVMVWTLNRALPGAGVFLCVFAGLQVCFGFGLASAPLPMILLAGALSCVPVLLSAVTRRRLERISRGSGGSGR
jgi:hypothetical protein